MEEIVFRVSGIEWPVPIVEGVLQIADFHRFVLALELKDSDFILSTMTQRYCVHSIVFGSDGAEKIYPWM